METDHYVMVGITNTRGVFLWVSLMSKGQLRRKIGYTELSLRLIAFFSYDVLQDLSPCGHMDLSPLYEY
jgi:hypothetical protein